MLRKIIIAFALGFALALAQDSKEVGLPSQPINGSTASTPSTSTVPATEIPTTSGVPVPHPNTTNAPSTTPTTPSTPPSTPPSNTTNPPATTSEPPPVTSTVLPPPSKGHYIVVNDNSTCILVDMALQIKVVDGNKTRDSDVFPNATTSGGVCNNETQELSVSWGEDKSENYTLIFQFSKNDTTKKFMVSQITLFVFQQNVTLNLTDSKPLFTASVSKSYRCEKEQEIKLAEQESNTTYAVLKLSHLQMQAYHTKGDFNKFSAAEDCANGSSPDIVPIAVGCALVGLIAIVLIAYLVGRRRSQARGYLSM